jgi:hypothetical protein
MNNRQMSIGNELIPSTAHHQPLGGCQVAAVRGEEQQQTVRKQLSHSPAAACWQRMKPLGGPFLAVGSKLGGKQNSVKLLVCTKGPLRS